MYKNFIFLLVIVLLSVSVNAQNSESSGLKNQTFLHPADAFTAYSFKKGEWAYNQSITPYPNWAWWGVTDWLTTEIDIEAWLGGVPSLNFRISLLEQNNVVPAIAFETMYQYINTEFDQMENLDYLNLKRKGSNWYNHINASWKLKSDLYVHLSFGATYSQNLSIENNDSVNYIGESFSDLISPDVSLAIDWRVANWLSLNTSYSYGSTFLYIDNVPRKNQFVLAARLAPLYKNNFGFFKSFRIELAYIDVSFNDASESIRGPIGFVYWQWNWNKHK